MSTNTNPYLRSKTFSEVYSEELRTKRIARERKKQVKRQAALQRKITKISMVCLILFLVYILTVPVLNPVKYEWVAVRVGAGDTLYGLQKEYAPNGNITFLMLQDKLKNTCTENLEVGQYVYVIAEKKLCD